MLSTPRSCDPARGNWKYWCIHEYLNIGGRIKFCDPARGNWKAFLPAWAAVTKNTLWSRERELKAFLTGSSLFRVSCFVIPREGIESSPLFIISTSYCLYLCDPARGNWKKRRRSRRGTHGEDIVIPREGIESSDLNRSDLSDPARGNWKNKTTASTAYRLWHYCDPARGNWK